jgi:hypothetical protein
MSRLGAAVASVAVEHIGNRLGSSGAAKRQAAFRGARISTG